MTEGAWNALFNHLIVFIPIDRAFYFLAVPDLSDSLPDYNAPTANSRPDHPDRAFKHGEDTAEEGADEASPSDDEDIVAGEWLSCGIGM